MKNKHLVEKALAKLCDEYTDPAVKVERVRKLITEFLTSQTATRVGKFDLSKFVAKDENRPAMTGVYNDPEGYKVATDGHVLCAVKADVEGVTGQVITPKGVRLTDKVYRRDDDGSLIIDADGSYIEDVVDYTYPNWRAVCPDISRGGYAEVDKPLECARITELYAAAKPEAKAHGKVVVFDYEYREGKSIRLRGDFLALFLSFLKTYPEAKVYARDATHAIYATDTEGNRCLLMPMTFHDTQYVVRI